MPKLSSSFTYRLGSSNVEGGWGPGLLRQVCRERGWRDYKDTGQDETWNFWWRAGGLNLCNYRNIKKWQFVNHIPRGFLICRKDNLARSLEYLKRVYGAIYDITPKTYYLPVDYTKLVSDTTRMKRNASWICKPVNACRGHGIFLFKDLNDVCYEHNTLVQEYINNPLLVGGYKFDLRLYICVPSFHPLTIYLYKEGLVRFATEQFCMDDIKNKYSHLTNSSVNRNAPLYAAPKDIIGSGCKWDLKRLRQYFSKVGIRDWLMWQNISILITLALLSHSSKVPKTRNCFELYGFDVLIDNNLKPWLLEVNFSPALSNHCETDPNVKKPMLHDMFDLLGFPDRKITLYQSIYTKWVKNNKGFKDYRKKVLDYKGWKTNENGEKFLKEVKKELAQKKKGRKIRSLIKLHKSDKTRSRSSSAVSTCSESAMRTKSQHRNSLTSPSYLKIETNIYDLMKSSAGQGDVKTKRKVNKKKSCHQSRRTECEEEDEGEIGIRRKTRGKSIGKNIEQNKSYISRVTVCSACNGVPKDTNQNRPGSKSQQRAPNTVANQSGPAASKSRQLMQTESCKSLKSSRNKKALIWGNGVDWNRPKCSAGKWLRIYPFTKKSFVNITGSHSRQQIAEKIKTSVEEMIDFHRKCQLIFHGNPKFNDDQLSQLLWKRMGMTTDVWLPSKS